QNAQVLHHLRSNSIPDDSSALKSVIAASLADVARYNSEIARFQQIQNRLIAERDHLQRHCDESRSLAAPVRRLPPEIIAEIFALC
ncbi:hypothetical protein K438DRAFT_1681389, partial [Mycena galopus ATCC 62051]